MKKVMYGTLFLALVGIGFSSCEKEEVEKPIDQIVTDNHSNEKYSAISFNNGYIEFKSIDSYYALLEDVESDDVEELTLYLRSLDFLSYGKLKGEESELDSDLMDAMLDKNKILKVGEWFIQIDFVGEKVFALSESINNAYQSLVNKSNREIKEFSTGDDVIDLLLNGFESELDRSCGGVGGFGQSSNKMYITTSVWYQTDVKFNRFGVFFELKGGFDSNDDFGVGSGIQIQFGGTEVWSERKPCNSSSVKTRNTNAINVSGVTKEYYNHYQNVRNLHGWYMYVKTKVSGSTTTMVGASVNY
ncbi:hypothetical protein DNU06_06155 [Putridiphycobacter roseus]|uniref:Uncharacterized protein n=1 Tax=Putridiphycobacter roseus TaxID=2219161 RepID=A0A2W1N2U8_9FLAO|nr:hypothetical protein [Putridiphycobacter roseus]PZE18194.1 hypothetical protein DNU06_06155 [Putridiphycobacter roseus]